MRFTTWDATALPDIFVLNLVGTVTGILSGDEMVEPPSLETFSSSTRAQIHIYGKMYILLVRHSQPKRRRVQS